MPIPVTFYLGSSYGNRMPRFLLWNGLLKLVKRMFHSPDVMFRTKGLEKVSAPPSLLNTWLKVPQCWEAGCPRLG